MRDTTWATAMLRAAVVSALAAFTLEILAGAAIYVGARYYVEQHDPRGTSQMTGTVFYFRPLRLRRGDAIDLADLGEHLEAIGFHRTTDSVPGSFALTEKTLSIRSRL